MEKKPLTAKQKAQLEELNALRREVAEPLERLRKSLSDGKPLADQVKGLFRFLEELQMERRLEEQARELDARGAYRQAQIINQLWEILVSALEQMHDVLGQTRWEPEQFRRLLRLLLSQYDVGTIPPVLDAVQMGPISALRCHEAGHLLVLGAGEGSFPGYSGSKGVLTDQERMALRKLDVHLTGGGEEGIQEEFAEIYGVLCGAERSVRVYCSDEQPSYLFSRLSELCGGPEKADVQLEFAMAGKREAGAWFAQQRLPELAEALGAGESCAEILSRQDYRLGGLAAVNAGRPLWPGASAVCLPGGYPGGVSAAVFPEIRSEGQGAEARPGGSGGVRHLRPCCAGGYGALCPGGREASMPFRWRRPSPLPGKARSATGRSGSARWNPPGCKP